MGSGIKDSKLSLTDDRSRRSASRYCHLQNKPSKGPNRCILSILMPVKIMTSKGPARGTQCNGSVVLACTSRRYRCPPRGCQFARLCFIPSFDIGWVSHVDCSSAKGVPARSDQGCSYVACFRYFYVSSKFYLQVVTADGG